MAMHIIIDGYNVIRQSGPLIDLEAISMEEGRKGLIRLLSDYRKVKECDITVVFDGWQSDNYGTSEDRTMGIEVVYSGRGEKADEVIKRMADRLQDKIVVVTSDHEIEKHAIKKGSVVIPSGDFEMKVRMATGWDEYGYFEDEQDDDAGWDGDTKKKGPARKLSKEERKKREKMRKL